MESDKDVSRCKYFMYKNGNIHKVMFGVRERYSSLTFGH